MGSVSPDETTGLLIEREQDNGEAISSTSDTASDASVTDSSQISPLAVLPLALLAALAIAATAATTIFAYATLLCRDPTHCQDAEQNLYAGAVAVATIVANMSALVVLGPLEKLSKINGKAGLILWLVCRTMSVTVLAFGGKPLCFCYLPRLNRSADRLFPVYIRSIVVTISGRLFSGLASDNILHFNLNAIYVQTPDKRQASRLIGASLALYMIGISMSPTIAGLLDNFRASFTMALSIFAFSLLYVLLCVRTRYRSHAVQDHNTKAVQEEHIGNSPFRKSLKKFLESLFSPLRSFIVRPFALMPGVSLLAYNAVQSYVFPAIMVHTSLRFGFSSKQNGFLLSIAHAVSSVYIFFSLFAAPYIYQLFWSHEVKGTSLTTRDSGVLVVSLALLSLLAQAVSLVLLALATYAWQMYPIITLFALGLATPSFIKSHVIRLFPTADASQAMAALTIMETMGSVLGPVVLGGWQVLWPGAGAFFAAAALIGVSTVLFALGALLGRIKRD